MVVYMIIASRHFQLFDIVLTLKTFAYSDEITQLYACHFPTFPTVIKRKANYHGDDKLVFEAQSIVALRCTKAYGRFFVAQLLDDVYQGMLDDSMMTVNVLYYGKKRNGKFNLRNYDVVPIRSIMCAIDLNQVNDNEHELPRRYLISNEYGYSGGIKRALDCIARGKNTPKAFISPIKRQKTHLERASTSEKIEKEVIVTIPRRNERTGLYENIGRPGQHTTDYEMYGKRGFRENAQDVLASTNKVIGAVLTKNYQLLECLTAPDMEHIYSFFAPRSVGIAKCALDYANDEKKLSNIEGLRVTITKSNIISCPDKNIVCNDEWNGLKLAIYSTSILRPKDIRLPR